MLVPLFPFFVIAVAVVDNDWLAIVPLFAASWALLGIEAAAVECERPFEWHSNHLPLGKMCIAVARGVALTLKNIGSQYEN